MESTALLVGIVVGICGLIISYLAYQAGSKKDVKQEGCDDGELKSDVKTIMRGIDDMRVDLREVTKSGNQNAKDIIRVEEIAKSAHKRIDEHIGLERG